MVEFILSAQQFRWLVLSQQQSTLIEFPQFLNQQFIFIKQTCENKNLRQS